MSEQHPNPTEPNSNPNPANESLLGGTAVSSGTVSSEGTVTSLGTVSAEPKIEFDPEKLTLAEGFEKGTHWEQFTNIAKESGLSQESAQKLVNLYAEAQKVNLDAWAQQNTDWQNEVKADPEVGGAKLDTVKQTISKVLDNTELSDPKFREALDFTGAGNHPAIIKTLYRWAQKLTEGGSVSGDPASRNADGSLAGQQRPSVATAIYGQDGPRTGGPFR